MLIISFCTDLSIGEQIVQFFFDKHLLQIHTAHSLKSRKIPLRNMTSDSTFGSSRNTYQVRLFVCSHHNFTIARAKLFYIITIP